MLSPKMLTIWLLWATSVSSLPLHRINSQDKKVFEIASDNKDYDEESENEMIKSKDLMNLNLYTENESRYEPLHSYVDNYNKREIMNKIQYTNIFFHPESNTWETYNVEENNIPFIAGFKEDLDKIIKGKHSRFI
ncbi:uncharacterized protein LOC122538618 [Frieseomelitta varia]|uniref:uncharacterized protein LOC122538618 n=1 Tax=Frieseomelitta varia TaxID=561572 RepID=UPI001CB6AF7E|nr:uncharacterized protein LOC122538618 [Frieseomelitta varia]